MAIAQLVSPSLAGAYPAGSASTAASGPHRATEPATPTPGQPTARPYPAGLIDTRLLPRRGRLTLRPVLPQDDHLLVALAAGLSPQARRNRFLGCARLSPASASQMTRVDHHQHLALVVTAWEGDQERLVADARYVVDRDQQGAEFALMVAEDWQRLGLASWALMALQHAAAHAGLTWLHGEVLDSNHAMLALMAHCGFAQAPSRSDAQTCVVEKRLHATGHRALPLPAARPGLWARLRWHTA